MPALTGADMAANYLVDDTWCAGCGLYLVVHGAHRPDCTVQPSPLICAQTGCDAMRLPSERGRLWQYRPCTDSYFCPDHHQKGATA